MVTRLPFRILTLTFSIFTLFPIALAAEEGTLSVVDTVEEAIALAEKNNRQVLLEIHQTGCSHCQLFQKKVLESNAFQEYAKKHLYLVFYDIKKKQELTEKQSAELTELMRDHHVQFTPTIIVFSPSGEKLLRTQGYKGTPTEAVIANLKSLSQP